MQIPGISSAAIFKTEGNKFPFDTAAGNNFLASISEYVTRSDVPAVNPGASKEFEFWDEDLQPAKKDKKLRTLDDVLADIEKVLRGLKR